MSVLYFPFPELLLLEEGRIGKEKITIYEVGVARIHLRWFFNSLQSYWHDDDCQASIFGKVTCYVTSSKNDAIFGQK